MEFTSMEFWGVEVKSGEPCSVEPGEGKIVHLSQACLGEVKKEKGSESIFLYVTVDGKRLVLGTLSSEKFRQQLFDLVLDRNFELSHNLKNGSVCFFGYRSNNSLADSEEDVGKSKSRARREKLPAAENTDAAKTMTEVKIVEPKKDVITVEEVNRSSDSSIEEEDSSSSSWEHNTVLAYGIDTDSDWCETTDSDSEEGQTEDEDDEEAPNKVEVGKKRPAESAIESPGTVKKAKLVTPQKKTDAKKEDGHVATPHPSKQAGKTLGNQSKQQTPKSAGSHPC